MIADGLLLDFEAVSTASIVKREEEWQLVGYVLADLDGESGIDAIGIAALGWRRRWTITLSELLERLGRSSVDIETSRYWGLSRDFGSPDGFVAGKGDRGGV